MKRIPKRIRHKPWCAIRWKMRETTTVSDTPEIDQMTETLAGLLSPLLGVASATETHAYPSRLIR